jgi:poly(glycerol-phosphate) alpha-glucosyltransferase
MLKRAQLFSEYENIYSEILTFNYNNDYAQIRKVLENKGYLSKKIKIINMFESLAKDTFSKVIINHSIEDEKYIIEPVKNRNCYRYFENGMYRMFKSFERADGKLKFIDYFNENHYKIKREEFDEYGIKRRDIHMDYLNNPSLPRQELYFDGSGKCYMNFWYKTVKGKSEIDRIHLFNGSKVNVFYGIDELRSYWLEIYINKKVNNFFIIDGRSIDPAVLSLENENVYKIFMTHSTHLRPPYQTDSVLRMGNRPVLNNLNDVDALVLLTNYQKKDIIQRFGIRNNYFVIPHSIKNNFTPNNLMDFKRKKCTGVMMARYHTEKQIDHAIRAFSIVTEKIPEAKLEIYGFGQEEDKLRKLINKLNLDNNVFLKGFTNSVDVIFEESTFSMLTSKYEGFGIALVESLAHGCPLISYDIKYGPSDLIDDGINGYLVKPNDIKSLAEKIIALLSDQKKLIEFSTNSRIKAREFSNSQFVSNWGTLFKDIIKNRKRMLDIKNFDFYMEYSNWLCADEFTYCVKGKISFNRNLSLHEIEDLNAKFILRERETKKEINVNKPIDIDINGVICFTISMGKFMKNLVMSEGIWDLNLSLNSNNFYQEKRIGYKKSNSAGESKRTLEEDVRGLSIVPYYTNPYGNLSFVVKSIK